MQYKAIFQYKNFLRNGCSTQIQSVNIISREKELLICGMADGHIKLVMGLGLNRIYGKDFSAELNNPIDHNLVHLDVSHKGFVSVLERDSNGNLWSAGGDNYLYYWRCLEIAEQY